MDSVIYGGFKYIAVSLRVQSRDFYSDNIQDTNQPDL